MIFFTPATSFTDLDSDHLSPPPPPASTACTRRARPLLFLNQQVASACRFLHRRDCRLFLHRRPSVSPSTTTTTTAGVSPSKTVPISPPSILPILAVSSGNFSLSPAIAAIVVRFSEVLRTAVSNRLAKVQGFLFRAAFLRCVPTFVQLII
ncbi:hypothetical protein LXL04_036029 [Taraxacum kok-saghyz]